MTIREMSRPSAARSANTQQEWHTSLLLPLAVISFLLVSQVGAFSAPPGSALKRSLVIQRSIALPLPDESTPTSKSSSDLDDADVWIENLDFEGFGREVNELGKRLSSMQSDDDVRHLEKIVSWRNAFALVGVATMWTTPNPLTILALSTWTYASWTMIAHHTCHGGYNRVDAGKFKSGKFAVKSLQRRVMDWCDWMHPDAWNIEHNR